MITILKRIALLTLAALMLLTAAACQKQAPDSDPGYILNPSNTEKPDAEITAFYEGNAAALEALAGYMMESDYLSYHYYNRMVDYDKGTMEFYVQKQTKRGGAWADTADQEAMRLVAVKFVGTVTRDAAISKDTVVFTPRLAAADKTLSLVYCGSDEGKEAVEAGKYHKDCAVTLTPIRGNWYCAEAVKAEK